MMSDKEEDDDRSPRSTPPKKLPKKGGWTRKKEGNTSSQHRSQNFRQQWLKDPAFKDWLLPDTNDSTKAKYAFCPGTSMVAEITNLKTHASTKKHLGNKPGSSGKTQTLTSLGFQKGITPQNKEKARAEIKLAAFFAEHNIAFSVADHLTALLKEVVTDSKLIKEIELKRTKVTGLVKNVLGGGHKADLAKKLQTKYFSVMTDETTDVSTIKTACVVVRYFDQEAEKICSASSTSIETQQYAASPSSANSPQIANTNFGTISKDDCHNYGDHEELSRNMSPLPPASGNASHSLNHPKIIIKRPPKTSSTPIGSQQYVASPSFANSPQITNNSLGLISQDDSLDYDNHKQSSVIYEGKGSQLGQFLLYNKKHEN